MFFTNKACWQAGFTPYCQPHMIVVGENTQQRPGTIGSQPK